MNPCTHTTTTGPCAATVDEPFVSTSGHQVEIRETVRGPLVIAHNQGPLALFIALPQPGLEDIAARVLIAQATLAATSALATKSCCLPERSQLQMAVAEYFLTLSKTHTNDGSNQ